MPSRVVTKRRVKRRQQRLVSKNAKRNARSVRKHRKTAKKVMRGGYLRITSEYDAPKVHNFATEPTISTGSGYVLYDAIPSTLPVDETTRTRNTIVINVPICVIFIVPKKPIDDIYLFFNEKASAEDITIAVKLLLGIKLETDFVLDPPIPSTTAAVEWYATEREHPLQHFLGNKFVKLTACGFVKGGVMTYCIETGEFNGRTELDTVQPTRHTIKTNDKTYKSLNGEKIKKFLDDSTENGFKARVLTSGKVLPDLYKKYFVLYDTNEQAVDEEELATLFGDDISPDEPDWNLKLIDPKAVWTTELYPAFRKEMIDKIRAAKLDTKTHKTYGLPPSNEVNALVQNRPLKITPPMEIQYGKMKVQEIVQKISSKASSWYKINFTEFSENWVNNMEENEYKNTLAAVEHAKKARVDGCVNHPNNSNYCDSASGD